MNTHASFSPRRELNAEAMRAPLSKARHLAAEIYASPQIAALEKENIFLTHWLCVGRVEEVPEVGNFMTLRIAEEPIVISRISDSEVAVFMNQCLHRGVEVAFGKGSARSFSCPYHAWGYDISGRLLAAPHMKQAEVDLSGARLPRVRSATWRGWIFINFDDEAQAFEDFIAPYEKELWYYRTDECRLADKLTIEVDCNWKFLVENLLDIYHVGTLHAKTFGKFLRGDQEKFQFKRLPKGGVAFTFESAPMTADGSQAFTTLPWLAERGAGFAGKAAVFPNMNLSNRSDSIRMWVLWPLSTGRTQIVSYLLFHESAFQSRDFNENLDEYREYMKSIVEEDRAAVESLQRVAKSVKFQPGPLSHLENAIHHTLNHYLDVMDF